MRTLTIGETNRRTRKEAWLERKAAKAYRRMARTSLPSGCINDAGRTHAEQKSMYDKWVRGGRKNPPSVAYPGTSLHEKGNAIDVAEPARKWLHKFGKYYGFLNPAWAKRPSMYEPWHFEYDPKRDRSKRVRIKVTKKLDASTYRAISRAVLRPRINRPSKPGGQRAFWRKVQRHINAIMKGEKGWEPLEVDGLDGPLTWEGLRLSLRKTNRVHKPGKNAKRKRIITCWQRALRAGKRNGWSQKNNLRSK